MQIVIDIDENVFTRLFDNGIEDYEIVNDDLFAIAKSIRNGTPLPKVGRWIDDRCSVCGKGTEDLIASPEWYRDEQPNFCPFCGVKLVYSQESEDKNDK